MGNHGDRSGPGVENYVHGSAVRRVIDLGLAAETRAQKVQFLPGESTLMQGLGLEERTYRNIHLSSR